MRSHIPSLLAMSRLLALAIVTVVAVVPAQPAAAQQVSRRAAIAIEQIVRAEMERQHIPGVALVVLRGGRVVHQAGYGFANLEHRVPVGPQTAFSIGSLSKQIIAAGVVLLAQESKLQLDASVSRYLPEAPGTWSSITIRHLLTHTAGLVREAPAFNPDKDLPIAELVHSGYSAPLISRPGEKFEYSNLGYFALAEVINRTVGGAWQDYFAARLFAPLGMTATRTTSAIDLIERRADGYGWRNGRHENVFPFRALRPSGAFVSTVADLAKWEAALLRGGPLSDASRAQLWSAVRLNSGEHAPYALGWRIATVEGRAEIGHGGSLPGFRSYYMRYPDAELAVIVLTNSGDADASVIARAVAQHQLAGAAAPPPRR